MRLISPSILAADFLHLEKDILMLNRHSDWIHLDVMDGSLVPNISFGFSVLEPVCKIAEIPTDVHLMIVNPDKYFKRCAEIGASYVSFHLEAAEKAGKSPSDWIGQIHELGMKAGIAINPDIPVEKLFPYLKEADFVLIMSVFAGFGGQKFIEDTYERVAKTKAEVIRQGTECLIEIDGGAGEHNAAALFNSGVDVIVAGSSVFKSASPADTIKAMREAQ